MMNCEYQTQCVRHYRTSLFINVFRMVDYDLNLKGYYSK